MNALDRKIKKVTDEVLKEIKPSDEEQKETLTEVNELVNDIQEAVGDEATIVLAGSLAKGTNLR